MSLEYVLGTKQLLSLFIILHWAIDRVMAQLGMIMFEGRV